MTFRSISTNFSSPFMSRSLLNHYLKRFGAFLSLSAITFLLLIAGPCISFAVDIPVSWKSPTTNTDGTALTDLAGFKLYYGTSPKTYTKVVDNVGNRTSYTVTGLPSGVYYFAVSAFDTSGNQSALSNEVCKVTLSLTTATGGTGRGIVTSSPAGINCGTDCSEAYTQGKVVTLTASASAGSMFSGWSGGGCSGTGQCVTTVNSSTSVTASFKVIP